MAWMTEESEFNSWQGEEVFLFFTTSIPGLGPILPAIQRVPEMLSPGAKWLLYEVTTHLHLVPSAKVNKWSYISISP
jgi:hypothetical protein